MRATGQHAGNEERHALDLPAIEREVAARWADIDLVGKLLTRPDSTTRPVWSCFVQPSPTTGVPDLGYARARTIADLYSRFKTMRGMTVPRGHGWDCHGLGVEVAVARELGLSDPRLSDPRLSDPGQSIFGLSNFGQSRIGKSEIRQPEAGQPESGQSQIGKSQIGKSQIGKTEIGITEIGGIGGIGGIEEYGVGRFVGRCRESALRHVHAFAATAERMGCVTDPSQAFRTMDPSYVESVWWSLNQIFDAGLLFKDYRVGRYCPSCRTPLAEHEVRGRRVFRKVAGTAVIVRFRTDRLPDGACPHLSGADLLVWTATPWMLPANSGVAVHPQGPYVIARRAGHGDKVVLAEARFARVLGDGWHIVETIGGSELAGVTYQRPFPPPDDGDGDFCLVMADRGVRTEAGTGIVQLAAAYGGGGLLPSGTPDPVGPDGRFGLEARSLAGQFFAEADPAVVADLSDRGLLFAATPHQVTRPHCWRCETPLLTRAMSAWFVGMSEIREQLREQTPQITWLPESRERRTDERFADWAVGRTSYWGVPLPIWECGRGHLTCVGSLTELSELAGRDLLSIDPHRPAVDEIVVRCRGCGAAAHRVAETLDASYDAGAMPFAQYGSPQRRSPSFAAAYPANLAVEGGDDTSNWCDATMVIGALSTGQLPFWAAIRPGSALDEDGHPMTGRQGNLAEPTALIDRHGADAMRWYFASLTRRPTRSGVPDAAISRLGRQVVGAYLGAVRFYLKHAGSTGRLEREALIRHATPPTARSVLDRWLLSESHSALGAATAALETFQSEVAARRIRRLLGDLTGWYIPLSSRRLADDAAPEALETLRVLRHCLDVLTRVLAPIVPFASDHAWNLIRDRDEPVSVHLATWPARLTTLVDERLNGQMAQVRALVGVGKAARAAASVEAWQPLAAARLAGEGTSAFTPELLALIAGELNVKTVQTVAAESGAAGSGAGTLEAAGPAGWVVISRRAGTVALDLAITPELRREGLARNSIRAIKNARRQGCLRLRDPIELSWTTSDNEVEAALTEFGPMIRRAVRAADSHRLAPGRGPGRDAIEYWSPEVGATFWITPLGSGSRSATA